MNNLKNGHIENEEKYYELKIEGLIHLTIDAEYSSRFNNEEEWRNSFNILAITNVDTFTFTKDDIHILNIEGFEDTNEKEINLSANILIEQNFSSLEVFNIEDIELDIDSNYNFDISELSVQIFN